MPTLNQPTQPVVLRRLARAAAAAIKCIAPGTVTVAALAAVAGITLAPSAARAAGPNGDAPPNSPAAERASFKVADGFDVTLFAAEPMLTKPIGMNFDAAGRLWVAGSSTYPQVKPGDVPDDKVYVLEDTDGDGVADKSTVFAEGLFLPTSVLPCADGGAYVANSTELLYLKDGDGDGKVTAAGLAKTGDRADVRRVVLSGFGTEDTHHIIHGFRWDFGGRFNFLQGIYIGSRVETPRGTKVALASTLWQLRPDSMDLGIYCQGLINPWGVTWDRYGQMYLTDGAGGEGVNFAPPGAQFTAADGASRVLKGLNPGSPKYCGAEIIDGRHFPADWQGDLITNDFRANRTVRFKLTEDGSGVSSKLMPDVITSTDKAYRPVDVKMGPDGALYIADWYNPIIQHGEVDFRDARRDKVHGRVWRVTAKGNKLVEKPKIVGASPIELAKLLASPEQWTRLQAKQQLKAADSTAAVEALAACLELDSTGWHVPKPAAVAASEPRQLETLWAYETLDKPNPALLTRVTQASDPHVRAAAVRVAGHWVGRVPDARKLAAAAVDDAHPRVRLEAVRALADMGRATGDIAVVPAALKALDKAMDPVLDFALFQLVSAMKDQWQPAVDGGSLKFDKPDHLTYALKAVQSGDAVKRVVADLKAGKTPVDKRKDAYDLVAAVGSATDLAALLDEASNAKLPPAVRASALTAMEKAARLRKEKAAGALSAPLGKLLADESPAVQEPAVRLAGLYKMAAAKPTLEKLLTDAKTPAAVRLAAGGALADLGPASTDTLKKAAAAGQPPAVRAAAIAALAGADVKAAAAVAGEYLTTAKAEDDPAPVLGAFLKREGGVAALADALKGKTVPADTAKLALRYLQGVGVDIGPLGEVLRTSAGGANGSGGGVVELSPADMKKTVDEVLAKGDPARGEAVYRSKVSACTQCHMIGGVGGPLAPDLRGIGATSPVDYLVESILNPGKAVKDGYAATTVATKDGDLVQGIKVREDAKELILRDNTRDEISVPIAEVKKRTEGGSLMPAGLQDGLTRQEFVDLIRFLSELGKPGPYAVPTAPVVRRWRVAPGAAATTEPLPTAEPRWEGAYATVAGDLPTAELPAGSYVRFDVQTAEAGPVKLTFNSAKGLTAWVDGKPATAAGNDVSAAVPGPGVWAVVLKVDPAARGGEPLRVEVADAPGSKARATPVIGR
jgi:putative heme-binding domain-containing protein